MTEIELVELLRDGYGGDGPGSLAWLGQLLAWCAAVGDQDVRAAVSRAQVADIEALSLGVDELASLIEQQAPSS